MWGGGDMQFAYRLKGATPLRNKSHSLPPTQEVSRGCPVSVRRSVLPVGFVPYAKKSSPACLRRNLEEDAGESRCGALSGRRLKIRSDFPPFLIPDIVNIGPFGGGSFAVQRADTCSALCTLRHNFSRLNVSNAVQRFYARLSISTPVALRCLGFK